MSIINLQRTNLPFRRNCEGYFFDSARNILAKTTSGFLEFPGGGAYDGEDIVQAMHRETLEETGAIIKNMKKIGELKVIWGENWAKTKKQQERYTRYKGDDMHFFAGKIDTFIKLRKKEEDFWHEEKLIPIKNAIQLLESSLSFDAELKEYQELQLKFLKILQKKMI